MLRPRRFRRSPACRMLGCVGAAWFEVRLCVTLRVCETTKRADATEAQWVFLNAPFPRFPASLLRLAHPGTDSANIGMYTETGISGDFDRSCRLYQIQRWGRARRHNQFRRLIYAAANFFV